MGALARELTIDQWITLIDTAVSAIGPGLIERPNWVSTVESTAYQLAQLALSASDDVIEAERQWEGVVIRVEDPAISRSGRQLNLARVVFHSESCPSPEDSTWVSRTDSEGQVLIAKAREALANKMLMKYTKRHVAQRQSGRVVRDAAGVIQTRAYLVALEPVDVNSEPKSRGKWYRSVEQEEEVAEQAGAEPETERIPQTSAELLAAAIERGIDPKVVKATMSNLCGPLKTSQRSAAEVAKVWFALTNNDR